MCVLLNFQVIAVSVCGGVSRHIRCLNSVCVYVCVEAEGRSAAPECVSAAGGVNGVFVGTDGAAGRASPDSRAGNLMKK